MEFMRCFGHDEGNNFLQEAVLQLCRHAHTMLRFFEERLFVKICRCILSETLYKKKMKIVSKLQGPFDHRENVVNNR